MAEGEEQNAPGSPQKVEPEKGYDDSGTLTSVNQYNVLSPLGRGSFAEVFLCEHSQTGVRAAMKVFNKSLLRRKRTITRTKAGVKVHNELEKVEKEIAIVRSLQHPNLVCHIESIDDEEEDQFFMIMELAELGPVMAYDKETRLFTSALTGGAVPEEVAKGYLLDIAAGLHYIHEHHVAHRDLKPDNVLRAADGRCQIADFGVAHHFRELDIAGTKEDIHALERSHSRGQVRDTEGTYSFWAPEMLTQGSFNAFACDNWATGVCFYIFITGQLPFFAEDVTELFEIIGKGELDLSAFSPEAKRVTMELLSVDVDKRGTVADIEKDPWLTRKQGDVPADVEIAPEVVPEVDPLSSGEDTLPAHDHVRPSSASKKKIVKRIGESITEATHKIESKIHDTTARLSGSFQRRSNGAVAPDPGSPTVSVTSTSTPTSPVSPKSPGLSYFLRGSGTTPRSRSTSTAQDEQ